ncbi:MAG: hypothetical protein WBA87_18215, partial [Microbacterium sp.]
SDVTASPPEAWAPLLGRYHDREDGSVISIEFRGGGLVCVHSATEPPLRLERTGEPDLFTFELDEWRFVRDASGRVIAVNAHGYPLHKEE